MHLFIGLMLAALLMLVVMPVMLMLALTVLS
jgi:hypothetical protein